MKKNKLKWAMLIVGVFLLIIGSIITIGIFIYAKDDPWNFIIDNFISITSFILTIFSIVLSAITYFSIDSVNAMTATTGNYIENENYSVEYSSKIKTVNENVECIKHKKSCSDSNAFEEFWLNVLGKKDKSKNFYDFSRHIQNAIDNLIWLNFMDCNNQKLQKAMQKFIKRTVKKAAYFESINSGLELLLDENIKLIIAVFKVYTSQPSLIKDNNKKNIFAKHYIARYIKPKNYDCCIQDVCGEMFKNPITKTIYLHAIGRELLNKMFNKYNISISPITYKHSGNENIEKFSSTDKEIIEIILKKLSESIERAADLSQSNIFLNAMVTETMVKGKYLKYLIDTSEKNQKDLSDCINSAIEKFNKTYQLFILADIDKEMFTLRCLYEKLDYLKSFSEQLQSSVDFTQLQFK